MSFFLGLAGGAMIATVVWVAFMAPKHWDWYQENKRLERALRVTAEERDHYKSMSYPSEWGTVEQREAGIKPTQRMVYPDVETGDVRFEFDDIRQTPE